MALTSVFGLPCLALVAQIISPVLAQLSNCNAAVNTISSQADADALSLCTSFSGTLTIASNYTGNLSFPNAQSVKGSLIASSCPSLQQINMPSLNTLERLELNDLANLTDVSFPALTYVDNLSLTSLPRISSANFSATVQGNYRPTMSNWTIHNTSLHGLSTSMALQISYIQISNNSALQTMNFSALTNVDNMIINTNAEGATLSMNTLWTAGNLSFSNLGYLDVPRLGQCNGDLLIENNNMLTLNLGNVTHVANNLMIQNNPQLNTLNITKLTLVGDTPGGINHPGPYYGNLTISNNGQLSDFTLYAVNVYGNLYLYGPWSNHLYITFWVLGSFELESTMHGAGGFDCTNLINQVKSNSLKVSSFVCNGVTASNTAIPDTDGSALTTGTKVGVGIGVIAAVLILVCTVWCCRRRKTKEAARKWERESLPFSQIPGPTHADSRSGNSGTGNQQPLYVAATLEPARPPTLDPGRQPVSPRPRSQSATQSATTQPFWVSTGPSLSAELGLDRRSMSDSEDDETLSHADTYVGEARMQQETGMEQTAPSSGVILGTEQLPRYEPPPDYKP